MDREGREVYWLSVGEILSIRFCYKTWDNINLLTDMEATSKELTPKGTYQFFSVVEPLFAVRIRRGHHPILRTIFSGKKSSINNVSNPGGGSERHIRTKGQMENIASL